MPAWFFIALGAPLLWAVGNFIDKILISRYFTNSSGALMIFSALMGTATMPFIALFHRGVFSITPSNAVLVMLSGLIAIFALVPYFYAMRRDDASLVVPLFQIIPVLNYVLAKIFLGEELSTQQITAGVIILLGAVGISLTFTNRHISVKGVTLSLMLLASALMAVAQLLFKKVGVQETFWVTTFWAYAGYTIAAIILLTCISSYRRQFRLFLSKHPKLIGVNIMNEILNIIGVTLFTFATLLAPLALVSLVNGFQPLFVVLIGLGLTIYFPKLLKENISKNEIIQKVVAILVMLVGTIVLNQSL